VNGDLGILFSLEGGMRWAVHYILYKSSYFLPTQRAECQNGCIIYYKPNLSKKFILPPREKPENPFPLYERGKVRMGVYRKCLEIEPGN